VDYFLARLSEEQGLRRRFMSQKALDELMAYDWPGNVRELRNIVELAAISSREENVIEVNDLPHLARMEAREVPIDRNFFRSIREEAERKAIEGLLKETNYSVSKAADRIGIHRTGLYRKIKEYGIAQKQ
jgi:two-component system, NtrC family, nitrogen regulation response regulator NtrX